MAQQGPGEAQGDGRHHRQRPTPRREAPSQHHIDERQRDTELQHELGGGLRFGKAQLVQAGADAVLGHEAFPHVLVEVIDHFAARDRAHVHVAANGEGALAVVVADGVDAAPRLHCGDARQRQHFAGRRLDGELADAGEVAALRFGQQQAHFELAVAFLEDLDAAAVVGGTQLPSQIGSGEAQRPAGGGEPEQPLIVAPRGVVAHVRHAIQGHQLAHRRVPGALQRRGVLAFQQDGKVREPTALAGDGKRIHRWRAFNVGKPLRGEPIRREVAPLRRDQLHLHGGELCAGLVLAVGAGRVAGDEVVHQIAAAGCFVRGREGLLEVGEERLLRRFIRTRNEPQVRPHFLKVEVEVELRLDPAGGPHQQRHDEHADRAGEHHAAIGHRVADEAAEALIPKAVEASLETRPPPARAHLPTLERMAQVAGQHQEALDQRRADDHRHDHRDLAHRGVIQGRQRNEGGQRGERRGDHRPEHPFGAGGGGHRRQLAGVKLRDGLLPDDDGVIDDDPQRHHQPDEADGVQAAAQPIEAE